MAGPIHVAAARVWRAYVTLPDARGWMVVTAIAAATAATVLAIGLPSGVLRVSPVPLAALVRILPMIFVVPALSEETVFRGLLVPARGEADRPWAWFALATILFTAWHVVEALTFLPKARPIFTEPAFLAMAAALGLGCGVARWRTGSLWPAVLIHWLAIAAWDGWLGGPALGALR